jgi:hypothetical protein
MKFAFLLLLALVTSVSAFAGDLYLICSTEVNAEEVFLLDKTIDQNSVSVQGSMHDPATGASIDVSLNIKTRFLTASSNNGDFNFSSFLELNLPVQVTELVSCRISD